MHFIDIMLQVFLDIKPSACSTPMSLPKSEDLAVIESKNFSELITVSGSALLGL